jgi:hypothetical protein
MIAEAAVPAGVRLEKVTGPEGVRRLIDAQQRAFRRDERSLRESLVVQQDSAPEIADLVVAMAGDETVPSARIGYLRGTDFAGLWRGATLPQWRRGIYRALVGYRAWFGADRGYRYLTVYALPTSRPILERVRFRWAATTTPYTWSPSCPPAALPLPLAAWPG